MNMSTKALSDRYSRQTMLPGWGAETQQQLLDATVLIVGIGGIGSATATYLAGAGVGHLILADPDKVSLSNLQRQVLYDTSMIGESKTECAARRLTSLNPHIRVTLVSEGLTPDNASQLISQADIVADCTDNYATRFLINDICRDLSTPWVYASIGEFQGQVSVFTPDSPTGYSDLFPDRDTLCSLPHATGGVIGAVPGVAGSVQAGEIIKFLTGKGTPAISRLISFNLLDLDFQVINL